jgi:large subunit ribosomal protein L2
MSLKTYKPYTKSTRTTILVDRKNIWKGSPVKSLTRGKTSSGGRNNLGRITSRSKGAGHKQRYRIIDFYRNKNDSGGIVERIEYDPNRTSYIALIKYEDNTRSYIICPENLKIGDTIVSGNQKEIKPGNCMPLKDIPPGTQLHCVELIEGNGGKLARSAGSSVILSGFDDEYAIIKLSSGETRKVRSNCKATIGVVSNPDQKNIQIGKAGRNRWKGKRPMVRGVAKNPVDHPHGGGEGKTSGGRNPVSPWGQSAKGLKTRKPKRSDKLIISRRKKRNKA